MTDGRQAKQLARQQRLNQLEDEIRAGFDVFIRTGNALKEIRDEELYKDAGFETWDDYLKQRVGEQFGIERAQAFKLIACAEIKPKLNGAVSTAVDTTEWSQKAIYELRRLAPRDDKRPDRYNLRGLRKTDAARVAKKVVEHCQKEGSAVTSGIVRKFVDEDLGIKPKPKPKPEEDERLPMLDEYVRRQTGSWQGVLSVLSRIPEEAWELLRQEHPQVLERARDAVESLAAFISRAQPDRQAIDPRNVPDLLRELTQEGKKNKVTMSPSTVLTLTYRLAKLLGYECVRGRWKRKRE